MRVSLKFRYRQKSLSAEVEVSEGELPIKLGEPIRRPSPGQIVVVYDEGALIFGAVVEEAGT